MHVYRLLGIVFWCGLSNHQTATAQMHLVETNIAECRSPPRSTSHFSHIWLRRAATPRSPVTSNAGLRQHGLGALPTAFGCAEPQRTQRPVPGGGRRDLST